MLIAAEGMRPFNDSLRLKSVLIPSPIRSPKSRADPRGRTRLREASFRFSCISFLQISENLASERTESICTCSRASLHHGVSDLSHSRSEAE